MKKTLLTALSAFFISCAVSSKTTFIPTAYTLRRGGDSVDVFACAEKYADYRGVYLNVNESLEHVVSNASWNFYRIRHIRYIVLHPDDQQLSTFSLTFNANQIVKKIFLIHKTPDGITKQYGLADLKKDRSSSGLWTYSFAYPGMQKGSIIEEAYELEYTDLFVNPPLSHDIPLQYDMPIEKIHFRYLYPSWWNIKIKKTGLTGSNSINSFAYTQTSKTVLEYKKQNVPAVEKEPFSPFYKEMANYLEFMITGLVVGNTNYNAPKSWSALSEGFKQYAIDRNSVLAKMFSTKIDDLSKTITKGCKTRIQQVDSINTWVQNNIRVVRGGPTSFNDVVDKRVGNIYLVTGLTQALLSRVNIPSFYVLIHSAEDGMLDSTYISNQQFYVPALTTTIGNTQHVLFPWLEGLPADHIPEAYQGQDALMIGQSGYAGMTKMPKGNSALNQTEEQYVVNINEEGIVDVAEKKIFTGSAAYTVRRKLGELKTDEVDRFLKTLLTYSDGAVTLKEQKILNRDEPQQPLEITLKYNIDNLVTVLPEEIIFQTAGLFAPSSTAKLTINPAERKNPIRIYYDERFRKTIQINYPVSWRLVTELKDVTEETTFGSVRLGVTPARGHVDISEELQLKKSEASKDKADELIRLLGNRSKLNIPSLIFQR